MVNNSLLSADNRYAMMRYVLGTSSDGTRRYGHPELVVLTSPTPASATALFDTGEMVTRWMLCDDIHRIPARNIDVDGDDETFVESYGGYDCDCDALYGMCECDTYIARYVVDATYDNLYDALRDYRYVTSGRHIPYLSAVMLAGSDVLVITNGS